MNVLFYVTATSCYTSSFIMEFQEWHKPSWFNTWHKWTGNIFHFPHHHFWNRKLWKTVEYKVHAELQKRKYLCGISRRKSSEAKSHKIMRNVFFYVNIQSQLFSIIRLSKNCFASTSMWYWVLSAFRNLQPSINIRAPGRGSRKGVVLCVGHCKQP